MTAAVAVVFAAAGLALGWAIGSAVAARHVRRRRETESMRNYADLVRVLSRTARPKSGDR
jgi:Na+/glutamate symporter